MLQLTRMTATAGGTLMDMQYNYSSTQNDGRITGAVDSVTGENTTYTYDALNRLTGASVSSGWATTYGYDGFGNLTAKNVVTGPAPALGVSYDANNHQIGLYYDANGNQTRDAAGVLGYGWDAENRMTGMGPLTGVSWNAYSYDPWGKRIMKHYHDTSGTDQQEYSFYGVTGQRLAVVFCDVSATPPCTISYDTYFGGKQVRTGMTGSGSGSTKVTDRLGSVRWNGAAISYYPYGEEKTTTADGTEKFGTYFRDGFGQDYADQRYYNSDRGRFWSVDPGGLATASIIFPSSLNRYVYVGGDPINFRDPRGQAKQATDDGCTFDDETDTLTCSASETEPLETGDGSLDEDDDGFFTWELGTIGPSGLVTFSVTATAGNGDSSQIPPPTDPNGNPLPPPVELPPGKQGQPNKWVPKPGCGNRPAKWVPQFPIPSPKGGQPGASWDDECGHWDVDDGNRVRTRYLPGGIKVDHKNNPITIVGIGAGVLGGSIILKVMEGLGAILAF